MIIIIIIIRGEEEEEVARFLTLTTKIFCCV
jgi:hypothetical protein